MLAKDGATEEEIRAALTPDVRAEIARALAGVEHELLPCGKLDPRPAGPLERFLAEIHAVMAITGGGWPPEQRQEWADQVAAELSDYPAMLVIPAVREARRRVWQPARFLSWVIEAIEEDTAKLRAERELICRLGRLAAA